MKPPIVMQLLRYAAAILARAIMLLAFSEFVFLNEDPVLGVVRAESLAIGLIHLLELIGFYLVPGALLFALERRVTGWSTAIVVGAMVGWSIEGAIVPAVYEAPPLSFVWTSIAWHAPVDVWLGIILLPRLLSRAPTAKGFVAIILAAICWGIWSSWTWPDVTLTLAEFALLAGISTIMIGLGLGLMRVASTGLKCPAPMGVVIYAINILPALLWATLQPVFAIALAVIVALNYAILRVSPVASPMGAQNAPRLGAAACYLALLGGVAIASYAAISTMGAPLDGIDMAALLALLGTILWAAALVSILRNARRARLTARAATS